MEMQILKKGALYSADCAKCGCTIFSHEWATWDNNEMRDAMKSGNTCCPECHGHADKDTFRYCGKQYAGRYSMSGYLDCTDWHYSANYRSLKRELRDLYGDR